MDYVVTGLSAEPFRKLFGRPDHELARQGVIRLTAGGTGRFPCRVTLEDAAPGETLLLLNHESHSAPTPYRASYAIFVREGAAVTAQYRNALPPVFRDRPIALRVFDAAGMLTGADLARDEALEPAIRRTLDRPEAAYLHAHNAAHGCFAAAIHRA